jgi:excisionase family DNA binding protein
MECQKYLSRSCAGQPDTARDDVTTIEAARLLGLAVRSVQLMVDRGDLQAWKTPGGHRRISRESLDRWRAGDRPAPAAPVPPTRPGAALRCDHVASRAGGRPADGAPRVLLIEDSTHFQNLISLLLRQKFPDVELRTATDGIVGLAMAGEFQPDVLMVDILLPGIDGATLITSLRSHPQFRQHAGDRHHLAGTGPAGTLHVRTVRASRWCTSRGWWPNCRPC